MTFIPLLTGKTFLYALRLGKLGNGSTWPGHIALRFDKYFVKDILSKNPHLKIILVAGTNGKTTTAQMIHHILEKSGKKVFQNKSGANLLNGIASTLIRHAVVSGKISYDYAIFEVDENALNRVLSQITPECIVFLNLFRDQLDRYGELNTIQTNWEKSLEKIHKNPGTTIILNADDPRIAYLGKKGQDVLYFGVQGKYKSLKQDAADSLMCPNCGKSLIYSSIVYSHLGNWKCPGCTYKRPKVAIDHLSTYPLDGTYNQYNTHAAVLTCIALGVSSDDAEKSLEDFKPAFGRQEVIKVNNKNVQIFLSKNPASFNQSLETIMNKNSEHLLFVLNDRIPDGRDVSWIWDTQIEDHDFTKTTVTVSGDRCFDMALRMKYAGVKATSEPVLDSAVKNALQTTPVNSTLFVLPTYSAMLDVRKILTGRKIL